MTEAGGDHAHVYFDPATRPVAERLRDTIVSRFAIELGGFSDEPRGRNRSRSSTSFSRLKSSKTLCRG